MQTMTHDERIDRVEHGLIQDGYKSILLTHHVARILDCSKWNVYRLVSQGRLECLDPRPWNGKPIRVERRAVAEHIASKR